MALRNHCRQKCVVNEIFFLNTERLNLIYHHEIWQIFEIDRFDCQKVQIGKDQGKAQSERDPHSKNRGGKKPN